jgi:hypothetical protein
MFGVKKGPLYRKQRRRELTALAGQVVYCRDKVGLVVQLGTTDLFVFACLAEGNGHGEVGFKGTASFVYPYMTFYAPHSAPSLPQLPSDV